MSFSVEGQQMMFAGGIKGDIFFQNDIVIGSVKLFGQMHTGILIEPAVDLLAHSGDTVGCFE